MLRSSEDFSSIFDFFFEKFAESSSFYDRGDNSENEILMHSIKTIGEKFYGETCQVSDFRMTEIIEQNFIHGTCFLDEHIVLVIYFTDLDLGLASVSMGGARFKFVRLKASPVPKGYGIHFSKETDLTVN